MRGLSYPAVIKKGEMAVGVRVEQRTSRFPWMSNEHLYIKEEKVKAGQILRPALHWLEDFVLGHPTLNQALQFRLGYVTTFESNRSFKLHE